VGQAPRGERCAGQALASFAVASTVLVVAVLGLGNLAFWIYAQNAVTAAAQEAAVVASREDGTAEDAQKTATALLVASLGPSADRISAIAVAVDPDAATATVRGNWPIVLLGPLASAPLAATATVERERFRPGGA
jgi:hypothetical protein